MLVDQQQKAISFKVVFAGLDTAGLSGIMDSVERKLPHPQSDSRMQSAETQVDMMRVHLGALSGFDISVTLYALRTSGPEKTRQLILKGTDAWVLVAGQGQDPDDVQAARDQILETIKTLNTDGFVPQEFIYYDGTVVADAHVSAPLRARFKFDFSGSSKQNPDVGADVFRAVVKSLLQRCASPSQSS